MRVGRNGFSLLELCVAIVVLTFVLFYMFQLIASGLRYQTQCRINAKLAMLAQKALEHERLEVFQYGSSNQPLPSAPPTRVRFPVPDNLFGYVVTYYTYEALEYPPDITIWILPLSSPDADKTMYIIAIKVDVDGPIDPGGGRQTGYRSIQVITLMHYPGYRSSSPPISNTMPANLHTAPPNPDIPVGMP